MKTKSLFKGLLLVAVLVLGGATSYAKGKIMVTPYLKTSYTIISAEPALEGLYSLSIISANGQLVYSSNKVENGAYFSRVFDFSKLEDGEYKVRLRSKSNNVTEEKFLIKDGILVTKETTQEVSPADVRIWKASDILYISHLNKNLNKMIVRLEDNNGSVVYDNSIPAMLTYSGKFNVSSLPKGNYSLSFVTGNKVFTYDFTK